MFESILAYLQRNKERIFTVLGELALIVFVVYVISEFLDFLTSQSWFRFDPFLAIAIIYLAWRFNSSLKKQNTIIEQQAKILDKIAKNSTTKKRK